MREIEGEGVEVVDVGFQVVVIVAFLGGVVLL